MNTKMLAITRLRATLNREEKNITTSPPTIQPMLHDENDALSLHFGSSTIQSCMHKAHPDRLILGYTRTMMGFLLFHPRPERIAMIGLGGGSLAKYCLHKFPALDFTAIELCPEVIALRDTFSIPPDSPRFRILCADGGEFVRQENASFDVLLVDGFDAHGLPPSLCSKAFYRNCRACLRPGGVFVANLCPDDASYARHLDNICAEFSGKAAAVPVDGEENSIVFAVADGNFPPSFGELTARLRELECQHPVGLDATAQQLLRWEQGKPAKHTRRR